MPKYFLREDKRALKSIIQINGWRKSFGEFATNLVISSHRWKLPSGDDDEDDGDDDDDDDDDADDDDDYDGDADVMEMVIA